MNFIPIKIFVRSKSRQIYFDIKFYVFWYKVYRIFYNNFTKNNSSNINRLRGTEKSYTVLRNSQYEILIVEH